MACSVCREMGHKKPNCPVVKEEQKQQQQQLITFLQTIPLILSNPLIIAGVWLQLSKMFPAINKLNTPIALAEFVPTLDLNLPSGVTLGAMIDKSDDTIKAYELAKDLLWNIPDFPDAPTFEDIEKVFDPITKPAGETLSDAEKAFRKLFGFDKE
tara:strand:- start:192 stop:656 length:465 start_codon:yes stop_codon:yes gene_type:complete